MRILHLTKTYLDENENWIYNQIEATPHSCTIATARYLAGSPVPTNARIILDPGRSWDSKQSGNESDRDQYRGFGSYLKRISSTRREITHAHAMDTAWRFLPALEFARSPVVVSVYGVDLTALPRLNRVWATRYPHLVTVPDAFTVQGRAGIRHLRELGIERSKIHVVPLGIPEKQIQTLPRLPNRRVRRYIQVAHFREKKGHEFTLRAFHQAFGRRTDVHLTLVGDTPRSRDTGIRESLLQYVSQHALPNVTVRPAVRYRDLGSLLLQHDFYVQPSVTTEQGDVEGGPLALLEAQARGLPVLSTTHENIPELVDHDSTGMLVPERDIDALASAMVKSDRMGDGDYTEMSRRALAKAALHTSQSTGATLAELYRSLM